MGDQEREERPLLAAAERDRPAWPDCGESAEDAQLMDAIDEAISRKPKGHDFIIDRRRKAPAVPRHMSVTGG